MLMGTADFILGRRRVVVHRQHPYHVRDKILFRELLASPSTTMPSGSSVQSPMSAFVVSRQSSPATSPVVQSSKRTAAESSMANMETPKRSRGHGNKKE